LGQSPHELIKRWSNFDPEKRILKGFTDEICKKMIKTEQANNEKSNAQGKDYIYQKGDMVYKKLLQKSKLTPLWERPYKIVALNNKRTVFTIKNLGHEEKINIKLIYPAGKGKLSDPVV
jgi:hypothetical protein